MDTLPRKGVGGVHTLLETVPTSSLPTEPRAAETGVEEGTGHGSSDGTGVDVVEVSVGDFEGGTLLREGVGQE